MDQDRATFHTGTHRACAPEQTWDRIQPFLSTVGITRVADVTWLDSVGIPTWQATRPASLSLSVSQGKGVTATAAKVSAVMESIEAWHAERIPVGARGTAHDLGVDYDLHRLPRVPGSLFHDGVVLDWVAGSELRTGRPTWVPHQLLLIDASPSARYRPPMFQASTNGLASGNTWDEATLHAVLEVIERELLNVAVGQPPRRLDLASVDDPTCRTLLDQLDRAGYQVVVHDTTTLADVSCYAASIGPPDFRIAFEGSGAHLDPAVALSRALTEAAQAALTSISGAREDINPGVYRVLGGQLPPPRTADAPVCEATVPFRTAGRTPGVSISKDLTFVVDIAAQLLGSEPLVVRHEHGVDIPVVQVVVPGARPDEPSSHRRPDAAQGAR